MLERFADTAGWAAWADDRETWHSRAVAAFDDVWNQGGRLVTTNFVLIELTALFARLRFDRQRQVNFFNDLTSDPSVEIVAVDPVLENAAWALWRGRLDKSWTLVDCASFVVMSKRGLTDAITTDRHFEQAGYIRLLK